MSAGSGINRMVKKAHAQLQTAGINNAHQYEAPTPTELQQKSEHRYQHPNGSKSHHC
jgi:hypothetical protein